MPELTPDMKAIEDRAFAARLNLGDLCQMANVSHSTWSRAKVRGTIRPRTLRRMEEALDLYERRQTEARANG